MNGALEAAIRLCGVVCVGFAAALLLRDRQKTVGFLCAAAAAIAVFAAALSECGGAVEELRSGIEASSFSGYAGILLKALGIAYIASLTEEICRGAGENLLASAAAVCGKAELLLLCLPLCTELLETAAGIL